MYFTVEEPWNFYVDLFIAVGCIFIVARALYALLHRRKGARGPPKSIAPPRGPAGHHPRPPYPTAGEEAPPEDWLASMRSMSAEFRETM